MNAQNGKSSGRENFELHLALGAIRIRIRESKDNCVCRNAADEVQRPAHQTFCINQKAVRYPSSLKMYVDRCLRIVASSSQSVQNFLVIFGANIDDARAVSRCLAPQSAALQALR